MQEEWEVCVADNDYEISTTYPYPIRRKSNHKQPTESVNSDGYRRLKLNGKDYRKHIIVAKQWVPNPDNLPIVDHINRDHNDWHKENLHWVSYSTNNKNKSRNRGKEYVWLDVIPDTAEPLTEYKEHTLEGYYVDRNEHKLYIKVYNQYREIDALRNKGHHYFNVRDVNQTGVKVNYNSIFIN